MPTWAITGGSGHVGQVLAARLLKEGHRVRLLDTAPPPLTISGVEFIRGSVIDPADVWRLLTGEGNAASADVVVHLAGAGMSGRGMLDKKLCTDVNVGGARTVIDSVQALCKGRTQHVCLVHMSSYNVVFHGQYVLGGDECAEYSTASDHTDFYGASKAEAERIVGSKARMGHG